MMGGTLVEPMSAWTKSAAARATVFGHLPLWVQDALVWKRLLRKLKHERGA